MAADRSGGKPQCNGGNLQAAAQTVHHKGSQCLTLHVLGNDEEQTANNPEGDANTNKIERSEDNRTVSNDVASMRERIESRHGIHTVEHAEKIGLGSRQYKLVSIDGKE